MATSEVQIANMALAWLGETGRIESLNEASKQARLVRQFWPEVRDAVLSSEDWQWARRTATLIESGDSPTTPWTYRYVLPRDCVRPVLVTNASTHAWEEQQPTRWAMEYTDANEPTLLCDEADAELVYISNLVAVPVYPPNAVLAMALHLAFFLAQPLRADPQLAANAFQAYQVQLAKARGENSAQRQHPSSPSMPRGIYERRL